MCERHGQTRAAGHDSRATGTGWTILREEEKERDRELGCACGCWLRHCVCPRACEKQQHCAERWTWAPITLSGTAHRHNQEVLAPLLCEFLSEERRKWEGEGGEEKKTSVLVTEITSCFPRSLSVLGIRLQWDARAHSQLHTWCIVRQPYLLLGKARFGLISTLNHHYLGYAAIPDGKYIIEWSLFPLIRFEKCDIFTPWAIY